MNGISMAFGQTFHSFSLSGLKKKHQGSLLKSCLLHSHSDAYQATEFLFSPLLCHPGPAAHFLWMCSVTTKQLPSLLLLWTTSPFHSDKNVQRIHAVHGNTEAHDAVQSIHTYINVLYTFMCDDFCSLCMIIICLYDLHCGAVFSMTPTGFTAVN